MPFLSLKTLCLYEKYYNRYTFSLLHCNIACVCIIYKYQKRKCCGDLVFVHFNTYKIEIDKDNQLKKNKIKEK